MSIPVSAVAIADVIALVHVELCAYVAFGPARSMAREVVRRGLHGELRAAVEDVSADLLLEDRTSLQGRVGRLWCEVALGISSTRRIEVWMQEHGYTADQIARAWCD